MFKKPFDKDPIDCTATCPIFGKQQTIRVHPMSLEAFKNGALLQVFVEHVIGDRLANEAMAELKAAAPLEDQITSDPTLPEACVVDVLQHFLLAGEYFNPEIGASPTLKLAISDAVTYIKELMDLHKVLAAQEDDGK